METTTIAVKEDTLKLLRKIKEETNVDSFDTLIKKLLIQTKRPKKSMFGVLRGVSKKFEREEIDRFS